MPSRTPDGKRLSGAQQQKLKLHRAATVVDATRQQLETAIKVVDKAIVDATPSPLRKLPPPPIDNGVEAVNEWLVSVLVMCGRSLQRNLDPARATVSCELARYMMGLGQRAAEAEAIDTLRRLHDHTHVPVQLDADEPPHDPVYLHLWTYRVLAQHLHLVATLDQADAALCHRAVQAAKAFALIGKIERGEQIEAERQRLKELVERRRREAKV